MITAIAIIGISSITGIIYYWNAWLLLDVMWIAENPLISAVYGIPISALLSILLIDSPTERQEKSGKKLGRRSFQDQSD
jgi:hypothetical protein